MFDKPRLSIVIVTYNSLSQIHVCLESLSAHPPSLEHETLIVDNASPDGTARAVRQRWTHVRVIEPAANLGFAGASNVGIRQACGEFRALAESGHDGVPPAPSTHWSRHSMPDLTSPLWVPGWSMRPAARSCHSAR